MGSSPSLSVLRVVPLRGWDRCTEHPYGYLREHLHEYLSDNADPLPHKYQVPRWPGPGRACPCSGRVSQAEISATARAQRIFCPLVFMCNTFGGA